MAAAARPHRTRSSLLGHGALSAAPSVMEPTSQRGLWLRAPPEPEASDGGSVGTNVQHEKSSSYEHAAHITEFWFSPAVTRDEAGLGPVPPTVEQWQRGRQHTERDIDSTGWRCPLGAPYRPLGGRVPLERESALQLVRSMKEVRSGSATVGSLLRRSGARRAHGTPPTGRRRLRRSARQRRRRSSAAMTCPKCRAGATHATPCLLRRRRRRLC